MYISVPLWTAGNDILKTHNDDKILKDNKHTVHTVLWRSEENTGFSKTRFPTVVCNYVGAGNQTQQAPSKGSKCS